MRERTPGTGLLAAAAAVFGVCCGLPVLATVGALGFLAGVSTTSWVLIVLGVVATVIGGWTFLGRGRLAGVESPRCQPGASEGPTLPKEQ